MYWPESEIEEINTGSDENKTNNEASNLDSSGIEGAAGEKRKKDEYNKSENKEQVRADNCIMPNELIFKIKDQCCPIYSQAKEGIKRSQNYAEKNNGNGDVDDDEDDDDIVALTEVKIDKSESNSEGICNELQMDDSLKNVYEGANVERSSDCAPVISVCSVEGEETSTMPIGKQPRRSSADEEAPCESEAGRGTSKNSVDHNIEKDDSSKLVGYQVQCVNLHCKSGYGLAEAPVFVLTYFGQTRRKNVLQKVCQDCFEIALHHQQGLAYRLKNRIPLMQADFPRHKDDVVVMDPVDEIYEEESLAQSEISKIENHLFTVVEETIKKYDVDYQLSKANDFLSARFGTLELNNKMINDELTSIERSITESRLQIYKDFTPKIKTLPAVNIIEPEENDESSKAAPKVKQNVKIIDSADARSPVPQMCLMLKGSPSRDIVSVEEVEVPKSKLPPIGTLWFPPLSAGDSIYFMKSTTFGMWLRGRIIEVLPRNAEGFAPKVVTGKQLAYCEPSSVRYPVGTRVIALFKNSDSPTREAYYVGLIAEPPKHLNKFRYLIFFDDGYAQYVRHENILLVCECSRFVHEDIHPESRDFIKNYLDQYPERPMVKLQQGQIVRTESNGKWWIARVMEIDGSLAKMFFIVDSRTEWIYRGSARLGPLYSELVAAAARKEQGALSRHRSLGIASLKKRNMPYVEYSVDQDDTKSPNSAGGISKNVAKKSTAHKTNSQDPSTWKNSGPPKPFEKMEYVTKGYIRTIDLSARISGRVFTPHQCGPSCLEWTNILRVKHPGLARMKSIDRGRRSRIVLPEEFLEALIRLDEEFPKHGDRMKFWHECVHFNFLPRQTIKSKGKHRGIMYRAPCGRRLRNMVEVHRYLRITKTPMGLDLFDFDSRVRVLDEFHLEPDMYRTRIKDISYGHENSPVSCVNEIDHLWPSFMDYSTRRIPQEGVNLCLDEEFLICCECTDDCQDKEKCECWQLTIEGTKLGPEGVADPTVGYQNKRLQEPVTTGIYECNQRCKCSSTCLNRVAQLPLQLNLQVFRTLNKGWGLRALNDIPQGGFICIYAGRLHTEQSANDDGRMYGDEYLAELDYIEVVERFKEGYESEVIEPKEKNDEEDEDGERYEHEKSVIKNDDLDYVPEGLKRLPQTENTVNTRARKKKKSSEEKAENDGEKHKEEVENKEESEPVTGNDDDDEMKKKPSKFTPAVPVDEERPRAYKSVREMFGDGADDCYIMDAKSSGNIGRYLNHSCQPNVFVQNVFVDTHDVRFPWVAFFALAHIKAGTELTWDYNYDVGSVPDKVLYCYCNNAECRGRLL